MKLLFTQDALASGGAERSHLEILSRFSETVEVVFVYFYPKHDLKEEYLKAGIRLIFLDIPETYHFPTAIARLVKLIKSEQPDLLISSLWRADQITRIASLLTRVPTVGTLVNDSYAPAAWNDKVGFRHKVVYYLDRATARIPVHWIANAQAIAYSHVQNLGLDFSKISVVYRGREVSNLAWKPNGGIRHFLSYGRLLERKGFQDLIRAFARLDYLLPQGWSLTIFGDGPYRMELETLVRSSGLDGKVIFPGSIEKASELLPRYDCFLFPSWYEGFSGALVEAMMAGIPIIASNIPMNREALGEDSGLLFPPLDVDQIVEQVVYATTHLPEMTMLGRNARNRAIEFFSIDRISATYEEKLHQIKNNL
ncbi:glycosyltransferase [Algoriphagus jejuensis]|uniref:Glycosyltransferase n=1 Tax=Algoriphagus jejuensis TaxID=419934 RepID=A0ABN1N5F3_9BACT